MEKEVEETNKSMRIFVGGLGEAVSDEDLRTLFASLGTVQTLQTIRTKGRSFAYLDFLSDPKSLSKLFSKFNGCLWKGGRLRLEKAKEDYLTRLKREWEQQEALPDAAQSSPVVLREMPTTNTANTHKSNTKHLNIYFPRLKKVKSIPFSGTGKHKYSFKNIKVPPLPVNFCDCEEHCSPFVTEREKLSIEGAVESGGMNDEEISIMNAVMNKLLGKEKVSNATNLWEKDSFESPDTVHSDECDDSETDEDDLIINVETKKNKKTLLGNQELERILENQESWLNKTKIAGEEPNQSIPQVQKSGKRSNSKPDNKKKRKSLPNLESESNGEVSTTHAAEVGSGARHTELDDDFGELTKVSWSQKSSWRKLLGDGNNTAFSASLVLPELDSDQNQERYDDVCAPLFTNKIENMERDGNLGIKPTNTRVTEKLAEVQPATNTPVIEEFTKTQPTNKQVIQDIAEAQPTNKQVALAENQHNVAPNKTTGRGASWLRKQSWTQLVSENNNSFSISHILPGFTFPEPLAKEPLVKPASSNDSKHKGVAKDTINGVVSDGFDSREIIPEKIQHIGADDIASASVAEEKLETSPLERSTENDEIGETCSFMRSAASLKEWAKAKAAISGSLKRKRGEK